MEVMSISDIPAIRLGNAQDLTGATGCTVILCPEGATAGVDVRGGEQGLDVSDAGQTFRAGWRLCEDSPIR